MNKTEARDLISKGFKSLPASVISLHQRAHLDLLKSLIQEHNFSHVASYVSLQNEVSTEKINKFLLNSKIKLYLPKIDPKRNILDFILCEKKTEFKENSLGILEPVGNQIIQLKELDAVIVPLRAFNRQFKRLGFGGGFYDKTFSVETQPKFIGLAYKFQYLKKLNLEDFDIKLDVVLTDRILFEKSLIA